MSFSGTAMSSPADYYNRQFPLDILRFGQNTERYGHLSFSRYVSKHQEDWEDYLSYRPNPEELEQFEWWFSIHDLYLDQEGGSRDLLEGIAKAEIPNFLCALYYTVLIDQVMFTHRRSDYHAFRAKTRYPKMLENKTLNPFYQWMAKPSTIFSDEVLQARGLSLPSMKRCMDAWAEFIVTDLKNFFWHRRIGNTHWADVRQAILLDRDCSTGAMGTLIHEQLLKTKTDAA